MDESILNKDIDECEDTNGGCSHTCENIDGGYNCLCNTGWYVGADGHACIGNSKTFMQLTR